MLNWVCWGNILGSLKLLYHADHNHCLCCAGLGLPYEGLRKQGAQYTSHILYFLLQGLPSIDRPLILGNSHSVSHLEAHCEFGPRDPRDNTPQLGVLSSYPEPYIFPRIPR